MERRSRRYTSTPWFVITRQYYYPRHGAGFTCWPETKGVFTRQHRTKQHTTSTRRTVASAQSVSEIDPNARSRTGHLQPQRPGTIVRPLAEENHDDQKAGIEVKHPSCCLPFLSRTSTNTTELWSPTSSLAENTNIKNAVAMPAISSHKSRC